VLWTTAALTGGSRSRVEDKVSAWQLGDGKKEAYIALTLNNVLGKEFWAGGIFKVIGDTAQLMGQLSSKGVHHNPVNVQANLIIIGFYQLWSWYWNDRRSLPVDDIHLSALLVQYADGHSDSYRLVRVVVQAWIDCFSLLERGQYIPRIRTCQSYVH